MKIKDLKVGDLVYIREDLEDWKIYGALIYYPKMHTGVVKIKHISIDYFKVQDGIGYLYSTKMIDWDKTMHLRYMENLSGVHDEEQDNVNSPSHYGGGGKHNIECYKAIEYILDNLENVPEKYFGHVSNIVKYVWRCNDKNGYEDLDKASVYFDFMFREED